MTGKKFYLRHKKSKEVISLVIADTFEEALSYFCGVKKLNSKDLLSIYVITE